tara:strand:+ start:154 stop:396 length:243 start_codon:yes stop_codon:yes gene_type:complete
MVEQQLTEILNIWLSDGNTMCRNINIPQHPEFIYRKSGDWKGWNDFLGVSPSSVEWNQNKEQDELEDSVWKLYITISYRN